MAYTADFQPVNLAQIYGAADQANNQQLQNQVLQLQMKKAQKADDDEAALQSAFSGAISPDGTLNRNTLYANLYKVNPQKALEFQNSFNQQDIATAKNNREIQSAKLADAEKIGTILKQGATSVLANPTLDNAMYQTQQFGKLTGQDVTNELQNLQQIGDNPDALRKWAAGHALNAEQLLPKTQLQDTGGTSNVLNIDPLTGKPTVVSTTAKTMTPGEIASNQVAQGNLGVARANLGVNQQRLGIDQQKLALEQQNGGQKAPAGYRYLPNGQLEAIPGGPGDKTLNPTEVQGKAALFGARAAEADKILSNLSAQGVNTPGLIKQGVESIPLIGGGLAMGVNSLPTALGGPTPKQQQVEQAQRDFVNAVLRQESGASISESEFQNAKKQYFNQPGDSAAVKAQKAANRKTAIEGFKNMAGPVGNNIQIPSGASGGWQNGQQFDSIPNPSKLPEGSVIVDNQTGKRMKVVNGKLQIAQ